MDTIIIRYAELGLKGNNRLFYERRLVKNLKLCLKENQVDFEHVRRIRGRIFVSAGKSAIPLIKNIFGISSLSHAAVVKPELEEIKRAALEYAKAREFDSFRITAQKLNNQFPIGTMELERSVGEVIFETLHKKVSLKNPELNLHIEVADKAYLFSEKEPGPGGLPVGTQSRVLSLLDDKYSLLSTVLIMRRGCAVALCSLAGFDFAPLKKFCYGTNIKFRVIKDYSELESLASELKVKAIVVSDRISSIKKYPSNMPILRPLIGYDQKELEKGYKKYFG